MDTFIAAQLYDPRDSSFIGWVIVKDGSPTLVSRQYYVAGEQEELTDQLDRLKDENRVLAHWPSVDDPEVRYLLDDETWEPIEKEWQQVPVKGPDGQPIVLEEGPPDEPWSAVFQTEARLVPKSPVEATARAKTAQELVARARIAREGDVS